MGDGIIACPSAACRAAGRSPSPRGDIQCCARHAQLPRAHGYSYAGTALARSRSSFSEPSKMDTSTQPQGFLVGVRQILIHGAITLLAIVIAFSLPPAARYILYVWWPRVETDTSLLLVTEIGLASALVLLFNLGKVAWDNRNKVAMARLTAPGRDLRRHPAGAGPLAQESQRTDLPGSGAGPGSGPSRRQ